MALAKGWVGRSDEKATEAGPLYNGKRQGHVRRLPSYRLPLAVMPMAPSPYARLFDASAQFSAHQGE